MPTFTGPMRLRARLSTNEEEARPMIWNHARRVGGQRRRGGYMAGQRARPNRRPGLRAVRRGWYELAVARRASIADGESIRLPVGAAAGARTGRLGTLRRARTRLRQHGQ